MNKFKVTFKDDEGTWASTLTLLEVANLSHTAASKIHRVEDLSFNTLERRLSDLQGLVDDICDYGTRNPTSAPQCVIDLVEFIEETNNG